MGHMLNFKLEPLPIHFIVLRSLRIRVERSTRSIFPDFARLVAEPVELPPPLSPFSNYIKI